jgi:phage terminase large subunit-like protein
VRSPLVPFITNVCNLKLRPFQVDFLEEFAREDDGIRRYTAALWSLPRGNGKTEVAAAVALAMLVGDGRRYAEVIIAAGSRDQAAIAFQSARRMAESSAVLSKHLHVLPGRKVIVHRESDSYLRIVSREGPLQHGLRPTAVIFDELWNQPDRELWDALVGGLIKVPEPVLLCISTAGYDQASLLAELCERGEKGEDPRFLYRWHGLPADSGLDHTSAEAWKIANPAMACEDPFLPESGVRDSLSRMHEAEFRRWHLNQWTLTDTQWISLSAWEACRGEAPEEAPVVLAFSGTYSNDSAAIVGVAGAHVFVIDAWESDDELGIDRARVAAALKEAIGKYRPRRIVCNPHGWISEVQEWSATYGSALVAFEWAHQTKRKADACSRFYSAVMNRTLTHDGDPRLSRHLASAVVKETPEGAYISKGGRESPRKVELAVAAVMAYDQIGPEALPMIAWDD